MQMFIIFSERFSKLYANIISVNCYYMYFNCSLVIFSCCWFFKACF